MGLDLAASATPRRTSTSARRRIGVFLFWGIGDAVLTTPFLRALRAQYPDASIEAIGKPWLAELFGDERLFDAYHRLVPPWTRHRGKYRLWSPDWRHFIAAARALPRFDLVVSLRPDRRETLLARLLGAREFAGHAAEGGRAWVSADIGVDGRLPWFADATRREPRLYRGQLAAAAAMALFGVGPEPIPSLAVRPPPEDLIGRLKAAGYRGGPVLAIAFGAAEPTRRWSSERIGRALAGVHRRPGAAIVIASDDSPPVERLAGIPWINWRGPLPELKRVLAVADVLFSTDSGVMHVGHALGCRVVAVFGPGSIQRFAPPAPHLVYALQPMPCRPCSDYCIHPTPICMTEIEPVRVSPLVDAALASVREPRAEAHLAVLEDMPG
jgi:ADP-heptose:LPS heptosyltransferase